MSRKRCTQSRKRAPRGTGTAFFSEYHGHWIAKKTVAGHRVEKTGRTQAEAIRNRDRALPPESKTTLADWCARWLESLDVKPQSHDAYASCVSGRINSELGRRSVPSITPFDVKVAAKKWGESVAAGTVRKTLAVLSAALQAATVAGLATSNPARAIRRPRAPAPKLDLFTADEMRLIVTHALTSPRYRIFALCASTGCRVGEASAIQSGDYDPESGRWSITGTLTREHGITSPKSTNSRRTIRVPAAGRMALEAGIVSRAYPTVRKWWERLLADLGLRARGAHQLRHTVASHAIAAGVPLANVARDLGDTVETLVRVYVHPVAGADVCGAMEGLLGGDKVDAKAKNGSNSRRMKRK